jgi:uncharacterized membrane protein SpoIIM required for sporulation
VEYATFVTNGTPAWDRMAALAAQGRGGLADLRATELEELVATHRSVVSDFAWARTHFPESAVTARLRSLAFEGHRLLAKPEPPLLRRAWRFLALGYPAVFRECLPTVAVATGLFCGGTVMGIVVGGVNPDMARLFIGEEGLEGLRHGTIWTDAIGDQMSSTTLSTAIFTNNIKVALIAWAGGVLAGLGSVFALLFNGLMFGSVLVVSWRYDLLDRLHAWIAAHGPLELFLICVAGGAGLELARGMVEDQGIPRAQATAEAGRRSVRLALGTVPWFVLCGIIEGTVSPDMALPTAVKQVVGVALLLSFLVYVLAPRARPAEAQ